MVRSFILELRCNEYARSYKRVLRSVALELRTKLYIARSTACLDLDLVVAHHLFHHEK